MTLKYDPEHGDILDEQGRQVASLQPGPDRDRLGYLMAAAEQTDADYEKAKMYVADEALRVWPMQKAMAILLDLAAKHWKGERPAGWLEAELEVERALRQGRKP